MSDINTVNLVNQMQSMAAKAESAISGAEHEQSSFHLIFQNAFNQVSELNHHADSMKTRFEFGDPNVSIAGVKIAEQKSNLGLVAVMQVKNKIVQAYQDIMNMPV